MKRLCIALIGCLAFAQVLPFRLGKPIEARLGNGESQRYPITLPKDRYVAIALEPRGLRLSVSLLSPDGKTAVMIQDTALLESPIYLGLISTEPGTYLLSVSRLDEAGTGPYAVSIAELRATSPQDPQRIEAEADYRDALEIMAKDTRETRLAALAKYQHARSLWRETGDRASEARALKRIGWVYFRMGESRWAIEAYEQLLANSRDIHDRLLEGETLNNLGLEYSNLGEHEKALEYLEEALAVQREINHPRVSSVVSNIGFVYLHMGDIPKALEYAQKALPLRRATGDRPGEAATLSIIAVGYRTQGRYQEALNTFQQAMNLWRGIGDRQREGLALSNIGQMYLALDDPDLALEHLQRARSLQHDAGDRTGEATTLSRIGTAYLSENQLTRAAEFFSQALDIDRELGNHEKQASDLNSLGAAYSQLGRLANAFQCFTQARSFANTAKVRVEEARALVGTSEAYLLQGKPSEARKPAEDALSVLRAGDLREPQKAAHVALAKAKAGLGDLEGAREDLQAAIEITESIRSSVAGAEFRASYLAAAHGEYELLVDTLMRLHRASPDKGYEAEAFSVSERARARSLLELLGESRADIREGVDPELLERENRLRATLSVKAAASDREAENLVLQYRELQNQIRVHSPRYAALAFPQPMALAEIQRNLLDPDTLLLEFELGDTRSYVFIVSENAIQCHELPARAIIEAAARKVNAAFSNSPMSGKQEIQALSRLLLGSLEGKLARKRLIIVSEGALQYIPFAALTDRSGEPLTAKHEIIGLPSASTLVTLRREFATRPASPKTLIAFGDPVFEPNDPRVRRKSDRRGPGGTQMSVLARSAKNSGVTRFERLPGTRKEVDSIAALVGASQGRKLLDFEASRDAAMNVDLSQYRIIHFATHGLLNNQNPEFSGLVLSLVDSSGLSVDGFLRTSDIYNLRLRADLVVLSACETALGKEIKGEGIVGLTRGFMYAGSPRVIASLWKIPDLASSELMKHFYRGMLVNGLRPAAALRAAQAAVRNNPRTAAPYYWAGFILQGEWN